MLGMSGKQAERIVSNKRQIFSRLILYKGVDETGVDMGRPLPCGHKWVPTYTMTLKPAWLVSLASDFNDYERDDCNYKNYQNKGSIKTRAENITHQFTTGQGEQHQKYTECC